jgi:hypothetical protein
LYHDVGPSWIHASQMLMLSIDMTRRLIQVSRFSAQTWLLSIRDTHPSHDN